MHAPCFVKVRRPAVAASFYPASAVELACTVELLLEGARRFAMPGAKAIIAPHAGYAYSGAVAAAAWASVRTARGRAQRVVLLGPAHYLDVDGVATSEAAGFTTPMGELVVDRAAIDAVETLPGVAPLDVAHAPEHSLEVQLPFVQIALGHVRIVPLLVGAHGAEEDIGRVLDVLWGGDETLVVVSSDLSHYLDYEASRVRDARTTRAIERLDAEAIGADDACGPLAVRALLRAARRRAMSAAALDVRSSGDTVGGRDDVVGYGAYAFW
jgi:AmmeMemoRadiSam system protein B